MSEMVKITKSKLESLSSAIRTKLGTDDTDLTLAEMASRILRPIRGSTLIEV